MPAGHMVNIFIPIYCWLFLTYVWCYRFIISYACCHSIYHFILIKTGVLYVYMNYETYRNRQMWLLLSTTLRELCTIETLQQFSLFSSFFIGKTNTLLNISPVQKFWFVWIKKKYFYSVHISTTSIYIMSHHLTI